jgi:hypothetical protein
VVNNENLAVVYCPECDGLHLTNKEGFIFKDEGGPFYLVYEISVSGPTLFRTHKMYIVGDL